MKYTPKNICAVCKKSKNKKLPTFMRCTCRGIIIGDKLNPIPKGGITIKNGKIKRISPVKKLMDKKAKKYLRERNKE